MKRSYLHYTETFFPNFQAIKSVFFTVLASPNLPVHICKEPQADQVYEKHAGSELLGVSKNPFHKMAAIYFSFFLVQLSSLKIKRNS